MDKEPESQEQEEPVEDASTLGTVSQFEEYYAKYRCAHVMRGPAPESLNSLNLGSLLKMWSGPSKEEGDAIIPFEQITIRCKFLF